MSDIITFSESLKQVSEPATIEEAPAIITKLEEALAQHPNGIGLSAIQIGIPKRIFVIAIQGDTPKEEKFIHFINPEVMDKGNQFTFEGEGCLSYPGIYLNTQRFQHFTLKRGLIDNGEYREETDYFYYSDVEDEKDIISIAVQHEYEHMDGNVIIDYGKERPTTPLERVSKKVGRNEKCPCGSTKNGKPVKYKKCCGR